MWQKYESRKWFKTAKHNVATTENGSIQLGYINWGQSQLNSYLCKKCFGKYKQKKNKGRTNLSKQNIC